MTEYCNDYGDSPECQGVADPRYTMDYTDVAPGCFIHWCAHCGPIAHTMQSAIDSAFEERPGFAQELSVATDKAQQEHRDRSH